MLSREDPEPPDARAALPRGRFLLCLQPWQQNGGHHLSTDVRWGENGQHLRTKKKITRVLHANKWADKLFPVLYETSAFFQNKSSEKPGQTPDDLLLPLQCPSEASSSRDTPTKWRLPVGKGHKCFPPTVPVHQFLLAFFWPEKNCVCLMLQFIN